MSTSAVKPQSSKWEMALLAAGFIAMIGATGFYVMMYGREDGVRELESWQVSAFSDLSSEDQAIYNALVTAQEDISSLQYDFGPWPSITTLEWFLVPPFAKDLFWENNGAVVWDYRDVVQEGEAQGYTLYHGGGGKAENQSAYILVIGHLHAGNLMANHNTIWIHGNADQALPSTSKTQSLILDGWKNVVPYTGQDEQRRLQGSNLN